MEQLEPRTLLDGMSVVNHLLVYDPFPNDARSAHVEPLGGPSPTGFTPQQIRTAYGINSISLGGITGDGSGQTIAIIDAYDNPGFVSTGDPAFDQSDLHKFDLQFGLPDPPSFQKLDQNGGTTYPAPGSSGGWAMEEALDVEWAHAIAPAANIILFEATTNNWSDLLIAVDTARNTPGVSAISMSFGTQAPEPDLRYFDPHFTTPTGHSGVTFVASTGDWGAPGGYPAFSPNVVAIGGTKLTLASGNTYSSETGWSGSGGGQSQYEPQPAYQTGVQRSGARQIPDVAFDADPASGVAVYDSFTNGSSTPWSKVGGTSLSAPCWAGLVAIANQLRVSQGSSPLDGFSQTLPYLYSLPTAQYHDITTGSNGLAAGPGYDMVTGIGTPMANFLVPDLATFVPPPTITGTSPSLSGGTVAAGTSTLAVNFSETVLGADTASNYLLQSAGADHLLGTADDTIVSLTATYAGTTATLNFSALPEDVYRLTVRSQITGAAGDALDGDGDYRAGGDWALDFVVVPATPAPVTLISPSGRRFEIGVASFSSGQILQDDNNSFDGDGGLLVDGTAWCPDTLAYTTADSGRTVVTSTGTSAGLLISRKVTVPSTGNEDFVRTLDSFTNTTGSSITTTVTITGNLGSDGATRVFATSSGDASASSWDQWIGTDDQFDDGGMPAVIHYIHSADGLQPIAAGVSGDNISWTYDLTVPAGETVSLAYFAIVGTSQSAAMAAASALFTPRWFAEQGAVYLSTAELNSLANFAFPPAILTGTSPALTGGTLASGTASLAVHFSRPVLGADQVANYQLQSAGPDGLLDTADDPIVPLTPSYSGITATLGFSSLAEDVYRLRVRATITDTLGHPLQNASGASTDWLTDFVVVSSGSAAPVTLTSPHGLPFDVAVGWGGAGQLLHGSNRAFDGDGRLYVNGTAFHPGQLTCTLGDGGHTVTTASGVVSGLTVQRQVSVPSIGAADIARTIDTFTNPGDSPVSVDVTIAGNLGSDDRTLIFATSSGDALFTRGDQWVGTDDNLDGAGSPAVIHYVHSSYGAQPSGVAISDDNVYWTYRLTVPAAGTARLAYFTIVATTRAQATAAATGLLTATDLADQAASYLTPAIARSLENFTFPSSDPPAVVSTSPSTSGGTVAAGATSLGLNFSKAMLGAAAAPNYRLQSAGPDGLLGTLDDQPISIVASYRSGTATLQFAPLLEDVYRLTLHGTITDQAGNRLDDADSISGDWIRDFVVVPSSSTFYNAPVYYTGTSPKGVTTADFNGDGILDVAVANSSASGSSLSIFPGNGLGGFSAGTTCGCGGISPTSIASGDFNHDGALDLAVVNSSSNIVAILSGDGAGHFALSATYATGGANPQWIVAADFDVDGNLDLAVVNTGTNSVGILLANSDGTFAASTALDTGGNAPSCAAVADFNADGRPDLAVTNSGSDTVAVLINRRSGGFATAQTYDSGGLLPLQLTAGDFNGDGRPDLAVMNTGNNQAFGAVALLLRTDSSFTAGTTIHLLYKNTQAIASGDFNGDGRLDLAISYRAGNYVQVLASDGGGHFTQGAIIGSGGLGPYALAVGDFNADGYSDLIATNCSTSLFAVFLCDGSGTLRPENRESFLTGRFPLQAAMGDFNRDGKPDVVTANNWSDNLAILINNGADGFSIPITIGTGGYGPRGVGVGDFNADGNPDIAFCLSTAVEILLGDGSGGFAPARSFLAGISYAIGMAVADFNGDGVCDVAVVNASAAGAASVLLGDGSGGLGPPTTFSSGGSMPVLAVAADFNGDGKRDLALANQGGSVGGSVAICLNNGDGTFSAAVPFNAGYYTLESITPLDFNGDGMLDVAASYGSSYPGGFPTAVLLGDGHGNLGTPRVAWADRQTLSNAVGDFNLDGYTDVVAGGASNVYLFLNNAGNQIAAPISYASGGYNPVALLAADFNGDGLSDVVAINQMSETAVLLPNTSGPAPLTLTSPGNFSFDIARGMFGAGELVHGANNALDGDGRLIVGGQPYRPAVLAPTTIDDGRTAVTANGAVAGLFVSRKVTVAGTGSEDFARTVDVFTNPTATEITTTVRIVGNLGSDAATTVWSTSDGDTDVEPTDRWIGTDDGDGTGTPAIIHFVHGPRGLQPTTIAVTGDNIEWTYEITVPAGSTVRLAMFTILANTRAQAESEAAALVNSEGFGGQAAAFLTRDELESLANFVSDTIPPEADILDVTPDPRTTAVPTVTIAFTEPVTGVDISHFTLTRDGTPISLAGTSVVAASEAEYTIDLSTLTFTAGSYTLTLVAAGSGIVDRAGNPLAADAADSWTIHSAVLGRHVFYNNSFYDADPSRGRDDDNAVATNKQALLPGETATFANYTSYNKGLNGIMVDVAGLGGTPTINDFLFRFGNATDVTSWTTWTGTPTIAVRPGAGTAGSDRITITWPDYNVLDPTNPNNARAKTWLEVTVLATANIGLAANDVFYFGNAIGESGNVAGNTFVDAFDFAGARDNPHNFLNRAAVTDPYDFNRDSLVNGGDLGAVRDNNTNFVSCLKLLTAPLLPGGGSAPRSSDVVQSSSTSNSVPGLAASDPTPYSPLPAPASQPCRSTLAERDLQSPNASTTAGVPESPPASSLSASHLPSTVYLLPTPSLSVSPTPASLPCRSPLAERDLQSPNASTTAVVPESPSASSLLVSRLPSTVYLLPTPASQPCRSSLAERDLQSPNAPTTAGAPESPSASSLPVSRLPSAVYLLPTPSSSAAAVDRLDLAVLAAQQLQARVDYGDLDLLLGGLGEGRRRGGARR